MRCSCLAQLGLLTACADTVDLTVEVDSGTNGYRDKSDVFDAGPGSVDPRASDASRPLEDPGYPIVPLDAGPCARWTVEASPGEALCSYVMPLPVTDPRTLLISVGGVWRARDDAEDGWRLEPDQRTVILLGAACAHTSSSLTWEITMLCMYPIAI